MFLFLLIVQTLVAAALIGVILMQRSEGGGLTGGSPSGMMSARGAADFLTRATTILATLFVVLSIVLAALAAQTGNRSINPEALKQQRPPAGSPLEQQPSPFNGAPQPAPAQPAAPGQAPAIPTLGGPQAPVQQQAPANQSGGVPIAQ